MSYWSPYVPGPEAPWSLARVVHLHRRAGFGATWSELQRDLADGPEASISRVLHGTSRIEGVPKHFEELSTTIGRAAVDGGDAARLKAWLVFRCQFTPDPLEERLTLMWHNHFATSLLKVANLSWMWQQNLTLRKLARAEFRILLTAMLNDPALLRWLDAAENRKGHPNENLAREVMELFSLGLGNYRERDIREVARALTGIKIEDGAVKLDASQHDDGQKTIFEQTGHFKADDLPELLTMHPAAADRIAWRLCREFFGEDVVSEHALRELAADLRANHLSIDQGVERILRSELFFSQQNLRTRVADPASYLIATIRSLEGYQHSPSTLASADALRRMGLDLFAPPNVGGWPGGRAWISTRTMIARTSAIADFVYGKMQLPQEPIDLVGLLQRHQIGGNLSDVVRFFSELFWGEAEPPFVSEFVQVAREEPDRAGQLRRLVALMLTSPSAQLH